MEITKFILEIINTGVIIFGAIIAFLGVSAWKKQIKGTKEFEISYNLNYSVLKLREAIKHVRNPAIWNSESDRAIKYFKENYPDREESDDSKRNFDKYVYEMRWEKITHAYTEMESHLLGAEVLWGSEILDKIKPLNKKVTELNISLQQYLNPEFRTKKYMELYDIVYDTSGEKGKDTFASEIDKEVESISKYIKEKTK